MANKAKNKFADALVKNHLKKASKKSDKRIGDALNSIVKQGKKAKNKARAYDNFGNTKNVYSTYGLNKKK